MMIYVYGAANIRGVSYKIGKTGRHLGARSQERTTGFYPGLVDATETLLAAFHGDASIESRLHSYFGHLALGGEHFSANPELEEWIHWLRHQPFTWLSEDEGPDDRVNWQTVAPGSDRRMILPVNDGLISQEDLYEPVSGTIDLRHTPWSRFAVWHPRFNDYYTPLWIVEAARKGMGGIDLDAASHWSANKILQIPKIFTQQDDAHKQDWVGRVWLNPPYGDNGPWVDDILRHWRAGRMTQLCWLSPSYVFNKQLTQSVMSEASLIICLTCPTDTMFWGYGAPTVKRPKPMWCEADKPALGRNDPHWIVYLGDRADEVAKAFLETGKGYPMTPYRTGQRRVLTEPCDA